MLTIDNYKKEVVEVLSDLDSTIDDFEYTKRKVKDKVGYDLVIKRKGHKYDISYESQGIRKIVNLLIDILGIFVGNTVLIDELDSSIGAKALIRIFNSIVNSNKNVKRQLIISSHNLILMGFGSFHASQLYIFSKDCKYQIIIRSIDDYELRYEKKNLPSLYLDVFGRIFWGLLNEKGYLLKIQMQVIMQRKTLYRSKNETQSGTQILRCKTIILKYLVFKIFSIWVYIY